MGGVAYVWMPAAVGVQPCANRSGRLLIRCACRPKTDGSFAPRHEFCSAGVQVGHDSARNRPESSPAEQLDHGGRGLVLICTLGEHQYAGARRRRSRRPPHPDTPRDHRRSPDGATVIHRVSTETVDSWTPLGPRQTSPWISALTQIAIARNVVPARRGRRRSDTEITSRCWTSRQASSGVLSPPALPARVSSTP